MVLASTNLVKKKNAKSVIWNYFGAHRTNEGLPVEGDHDKLICCFCRKVVLAKQGNITNMLQHLKEPHSFLYIEASQLILKRCNPSK